MTRGPVIRSANVATDNKSHITADDALVLGGGYKLGNVDFGHVNFIYA